MTQKCVQAASRQKIKFQTFVVEQSPPYIGIPPHTLSDYHNAKFLFVFAQLFDNLLQGKAFVATLSQYSLLSLPSLHWAPLNNISQGNHPIRNITLISFGQRLFLCMQGDELVLKGKEQLSATNEIKSTKKSMCGIEKVCLKKY